MSAGVLAHFKQNMKITDPDDLREIARLVRVDIVKMLYQAGSGHVGGSLSATDLLVALFFGTMQLNPENACWPERDFFVLSKGHAAPVLYAILARLGFFPREELFTLRQFGSLLQGHPDSKCTPGVEVPTGSLGQGLSVANGIALAQKLKSSRQRVYTLLGDGEIQEGQIWEAAMTAAHYRLDNLTAMLDRNHLQIDGRTRDVMSLEPLAEKWQAFGWHTVQIDGHSIPEILKALEVCRTETQRPSIIIAKTVKGKGVSIFEDQVRFHGVTPTREEYEQAMKELQAA